MTNDLMSLLRTVKFAAIASLLTIALPCGAQAAGDSCLAAARHLANLARNAWPSSDQGTPEGASDMVNMLWRKSSRGLVPGTARFRLPEYSRPALTERIKRAPVPFAPSRELWKALDDLQGEVTFFNLPGTDLLVANNIGGTANCNSTVFFSVRGAHANLVPAPRGWLDDVGGSCGLVRSFASVDGLPVIIDHSLDSGPNLASTLTLTPWANGKWRTPCAARFVFAPHFDMTKTLNDWPSLDNWEANDCGVDGCAKLQRAALELVKQTQQDRIGVEDRLLATMTTTQREEYQRLKRAADRLDLTDPTADGDDAGKPKTAPTLTDANPLLLPMVVDDRVFLASVGHLTIGWRVFADWKVTIEAAEADKTREIARFALGMTPGQITSVAIK